MTIENANRRIGRPPNRYCRCGCGTKLTGRKSTLYVNPAHRQRVYRAEAPKLDKPPPEHPIRKRDRIIAELVSTMNIAMEILDEVNADTEDWFDKLNLAQGYLSDAVAKYEEESGPL